MKRFYFMFAALLVALSAMAVAPHQISKSALGTVHTLSNVTSKKAPNHIKAAEKSVLATNHHIATRLAEGDVDEPDMPDVTVEVPDPIFFAEGKHVTTTCTSTEFSYGFFGLDYSASTLLNEVVYGDDGDVYIKNIFNNLPSGLYVKGQIQEDGKTVRVDFPQYCYYEEYEDEDGEMVAEAFMCGIVEILIDEEAGTLETPNVAPEDNFAIYAINDDGSLTLLVNDPESMVDENGYFIIPQRIIGLIADATPAENMWYGYGTAFQTIKEFNEVAPTIPSDVEFEPWAYVTAEGEAGFAQVGISGNDIYIKDVTEDLADLAIHGVIDGDEILIETGVFMGVAKELYPVYLMAVEWESDDWEAYTALPELVLNYDAAKKKITTDNPLIDIIYNAGNESYATLYYLSDPTFIYQTEEDMNANPENPECLYFYPFELGEGYIEWDIPFINVNGYVLDTERMYYHFLADGEVMALTAEDYPDIVEDEPIVDIPFNCGDDWDIMAMSSDHFITFKHDFKTFGLQSFYEGSDGVTYASDIVTYIPEDGVKAISAPKAVKTIEYFNMQGQRVSSPTAGLYVAVTTYADGTKSTSKVARR